MRKDEVDNLVLAKHPEAQGILNQLDLLEVKYLNKENQIETGQILIHLALSSDVKELFGYLLEQKFKLSKVVLIQDPKYNSDDELSMQDNNTSAFNFRFIKDTDRLSLHAYGCAIDINPRDNPVQKNGVTLQPQGAVRNLADNQTFKEGHAVVQWLESRGWEWGGRWNHYQDYHHFQKDIR